MNVLITGASSGIGAATALHLDAQGFNVFAGVQEFAVAPQGGSPRLRRIELNVTSEDSIAAAFAEIEGHVGRAGLDGIVNNAGVGFPAPLEVLLLDDLRRQLEINVIGQVAVTQNALPLIRRAGKLATALRPLVPDRIADNSASGRVPNRT